MKRNLNKTFAYIWVMTLVMMGGPAFGQRDNGGGNGRTQHVTVSGNVFGGGNLAPVAGNSNVIINQTDASIEKDVYGGGALANVGTDGDNSTTVQILDGIINGNVYGGGLGDSIGNGYFSQFGNTESVAAMVYGKVTVNIGAAPADLNNPNSEPTGNATLRGNVFGCNNVNGTPKDDVQVNIWRTAHTDDNKYPVDAQEHLTVTLDGLDVVDPDAQTYNNKFAINAVYGGGNKANYVPNRVTSGNPHSITVYVYGCKENTVKTVYGGGNAANVGTVGTSGITANTNILIDGGRFDRVFGGGNGYSADRNHDKPYLTTDLRCVESETERACEDYNPGANIYGTASTTIKGGLCRQVFGGSNQFGDITTVALSIDKSCEDLLIYESFGGANEAVISSNVETSLLCSTGSGDYHIGNFYGGSNMADIRGNVTLNVYGGTYTNVFGGSKGVGGTTNPVAANIVDNPNTTDVVEGNVTLNLHGGTMVNAFGGSDANGNISGNITVNLLQDGDCPLVVDTIYGGGQDAAYTPDIVNGKKIVSPVVNLWNGQVGENSGETVTVAGCVFGGGKGNGAVVTAHPKVNIGDIEHDGNSNQITVLGHVFGGGNAAEVDGIDSVLMLKANSEVVNLFGGGNKAAADSTVVMMTAGAAVDTIFGGGNLAGLSGAALVEVSAGTSRGGVYGGSNKSGNVVGDIAVNVTGGTIGAANRAANIHGGGYGQNTETQGHVTVNFGTNPDTHNESLKLYGDIYGGSALGMVNDAENGVDTTMVNILNGEIKKTTSGTIMGGNVYGGGLGDKGNSIAALVKGKVYVNIGTIDAGNLKGKAVIEGSVFGCNNQLGTPQDSVFVNIFKTHHTDTPIDNTYPMGIATIEALASNSASQAYAIQAVYGGGNEASYTPNLAGSDPRSATVHVYGCQENTIKDVYGGGNAADVGTTGDGAVSANTFVIIDGGRINRVFGGGKGVAGGVSANIYGTATTTVYAGLIDSIFGGSNQNGAISTANLVLAYATSSTCGDKLYNQVFGGANVAEIAAPLSTTIECGVGTIGDIYGGSNLANITNNVVLNIRGGHFANVFGGSKGAQGKPANISGNVELNLNGGEMVNAFGGSNVNGNIGGSITVNVLDTVTSCPLQVDTIYGAGQDAAYTPETVNGKKIVSPVVNLWHGQVGEKNDVNVVTVPGCVFGGGKGNGAVVTAHPKVNIGDIEHDGNSNQITVLGHVFGGGNAAGVDCIDSVLMLKANSEVVNLFGGGNKAAADSTVVMMTAGAAVDTIFGGGNLAGLSGAALVEVSAGTSRGGVYGGSNKSGNVVGDIAVNVTGGTIGTNDTQTANIHGGGYGTSTSTEGNVVVNIGAAPVAPSTTPTGDAVIWGDVYGGSADGSVNSDGSDHTWVTLYGGTINGSLYGGGLGIENDDCNVNGAVKVTVEGGYVKTTTNTSRTTGSVFGCNNAKGSPKSIVEVEINSTAPSSGSGNSKVYALQGVYGGGNLAAYVPTTPSADYPKVTVNGCASSIKDVYGGGNAAPVPNAKVVINGGDISRVFAGGNGESGTPAHIGWNNTDANPSTGNYGTGIATAEIKGGTILQVFGGSNANGVIRVSSSLDINKSTASGACPIKLGEVYGGGNEANGNAGTIAIGCTGDWTTGDGNTHEHHNSTDNRIGYELEGIGTVYGGANQANVNNNIELNITSGIVENVFGGNNTSGVISGTITVNIEKNNNATCAGDWYVGNVYGGGNKAPYQPATAGAYPAVNIKNGTVSQNVFGGGLGATAKVYSNPVVTVGDVNPDHSAYQAVVLGNVYGGGSAAMVGDDGETSSINNTTVTLQKANSAVAKVFGGGMAAGVTGTTTVNINNGTVSAGAYGGCDASGVVGGNIAVNVTGGTVGTNDAVSEDGVFGGGYGNGTSTTGNVTVAISGGDVYGDVYGGSAKGNVNDASDQTIVTLTSGTIHGDLYGGGLGDADYAAAVNGTVTVNVYGGTVTNVFGCNNVNGAPQSSVQVNINETTANTMSVTNVYGGGNHADYNGTPYVNIIAGTVSGNVYGGGNDITDGTKGVANSNVEMTGGTVLGGVYGGCNVNGTVTTNSLVKIYGGTIGSQSQLDANTVANVFGGGLGADTKVSGNVEVNIGNATTGPTIYGDVYGGSALGSVNTSSSNTTTVNILNGTLVAKTTNANGFTSYTGGNVFGGGLGEANNTLKGKVNGKVVVNIGAGTPDADHPYTVAVTGLSGNATIGGNVYGGNNSGGSPQDDVTVNIFQTAHTEGNAYGAVEVPGTDPTTYAIANVFGGGNEANFSPASSIAKTYVNVYTCVNTIRRVFGGGNAAATPEIETHIQGGRFYQVFGGGNGERGVDHGADVHGDVTLNLHGGNIGEYYGGSNQNGTISGGIFTEVLNDSPCPSVVIEDFFCGGNFVTIYGDLVTTIACSDGRFTNLYGGCNQANIYGNVILNLEGGTYTNVFGGSKGVANGVSADILAVTQAVYDEQHEDHPGLVVGQGGNVTLNLHGGKIENVFGGSNINGNIEGTITVNVLDKENSECPLVITNIYGGSNLTHYQPANPNAISPVVNVVHALRGISGNVYGGSKGIEGATTPTQVTASPLVNIGYESGMTGLPETSAYNPNSYSRKTTIQGNVFGGGDAAKVEGNTEIRLNKGTKVIGNVYGGGNMGEVNGDTKVIVNGKRQ